MDAIETQGSGGKGIRWWNERREQAGMNGARGVCEASGR